MVDEHLTRESLYAEMWREPMMKVAPRYGLSDHGLAKICEARNIPVPPRGYWAKLAHGKSYMFGATEGQEFDASRDGADF